MPLTLGEIVIELWAAWLRRKGYKPRHLDPVGVADTTSGYVGAHREHS